MELRSCYFCGAAGRTVKPRPVSDVDVTLCPRCEEKLGRLRAATDDETAADGPAATERAPPVTFDGATAPPGSGSGPANPEPRESDAGPGATDDEGSDPGGTSDADEAATPDAAEDEAPEPDEADQEPSDDAPATGVRGLGADDRGKRSTYRQALRLLRNREFPMERADTVDLLASAYDLEREECEGLLDLCVERGLLAETNGELREP